MRIGLDAIAMQSPDHARRGIGRYARNLVSALATAAGGHEFLLYVHPELPADLIPAFPGVAVREMAGGPPGGPSATVDRLARQNPDDLDVLLLLSPMEPWSSYTPPSPRGRPAIVAVVHDLIPLLLPETYLAPRRRGPWYDRGLRALARCDALLANSDATRDDCLAHLDLPAGRVTTIGTASGSSRFVPDRSEPMPPGAAGTLRRLGIDRPFVFSVAGLDPRKNLWAMIDAFALLPEPLRRGHQLVLTFELFGEDAKWIGRHAELRGVAGSLVLTGEVDDAELTTLYQRCEAFAFPSLYEGFGLPILEAMQCGAAVIAGDNSSQPEVVGDAGLLANASETGDIAEKLARVLGDPGLAADLRRKAVERAGQFSWEKAAGLALEAMAEAVARAASRPRRRRPARPRVAFFSPFPPARSGVADYAQSLVQALGSHYVVDRYLPEGAAFDPAWEADGSTTADARVFERVAAYRDYRGVVYQMGNSPHHRFLYPFLLKHAGVTTLHDFCLAGFHLGLGQSLGRRREHFAEELQHGDADRAREVLDLLDAHPDDPERIVTASASLGATLNRRVFERSRRVVVHSPWCVDRLAARHPDLAGKAAVIPLGSRAREVSPERKRAIRARFDLPAEALLVAAFGFIHPDKMNPESLLAFAEVARLHPEALLLFVGQEADGGEVRRGSEAAGLAGRVRFLGRQTAADFADLAAITDIGLNLRRPPTNGETSAALLDLLRHGVATIVTDVATFSDYPNAIVRKVRWQADGLAGLTAALADLAGDARARAALGRAAVAHVAAHHDWARVAEQYVEVIESCSARRKARAS